MSCRGFPGGASSKETTCQRRRCKRCRFDPWVGKIPQSRKWQPNPVFLPGKSLGQRSMVDYRLLSLKESDTTEQLSTKFPAFSYASVISHYSYGLGFFFFYHPFGNSLVVQWLVLTMGQGSVLGLGTKILQATQHGQKIFLKNQSFISVLYLLEAIG